MGDKKEISMFSVAVSKKGVDPKYLLAKVGENLADLLKQMKKYRESLQKMSEHFGFDINILNSQFGFPATQPVGEDFLKGVALNVNPFAETGMSNAQQGFLSGAVGNAIEPLSNAIDSSFVGADPMHSVFRRGLGSFVNNENEIGRLFSELRGMVR